jgi:NTP pyrophosphatase (non-canonical NTP hydrolase)
MKKMMTSFDEYQKAAEETAVYPGTYNLTYPTLGLAGEAGEVCEKVKKYIRGDYENMPRKEFVDMLKKEMGDVLWYLSAIATDLGISLEEVAVVNIEKLHSRKDRNKIKGDGDDR